MPGYSYCLLYDPSPKPTLSAPADRRQPLDMALLRTGTEKAEAPRDGRRHGNRFSGPVSSLLVAVGV